MQLLVHTTADAHLNTNHPDEFWVKSCCCAQSLFSSLRLKPGNFDLTTDCSAVWGGLFCPQSSHQQGKRHYLPFYGTNCFKTASWTKAANFVSWAATDWTIPNSFCLMNEFISTAQAKRADMLIKCLSILLNLLTRLPANEWNDAKFVTNEKPERKQALSTSRLEEGGGLHLYREITLFLSLLPISAL